MDDREDGLDDAEASIAEPAIDSPGDGVAGRGGVEADGGGDAGRTLSMGISRDRPGVADLLLLRATKVRAGPQTRPTR